MQIKILGPGCPKCQALEKNAREALAELAMDAEVIKVTDINEIMEYDVMMTPGLVVQNKVKVFGRVPGAEEIKRWIQEELG